MSKAALKTFIASEQSGLCALSDVPLPSSLPLIDTDRITPKADGGIYTHDNTRIVDPVAHMERHGNLRSRPVTLDDLKSKFDDRVQTMKLMLKINNQLLAVQRRVDNVNPDVVAFLEKSLIPVNERLAAIESSLTSSIKRYDDPLAKSALAVKGLGPITVCALTVYVDLESAPVPSSLWRYAGLNKSSHERYSKGTKSGGNKTLRTVLWNTAVSMMKNRDCPYREVYDRMKSRLEISEKVTKSRNTQGHLIECAWKDTKPSHRHGAALRAIMKHVLADYWLVGRTIKGLSTVPLYAEAVLGHSHIISPESRGWKY